MDTETHLKVLPAVRPSGPFQDLFSKRGFFDLLRTLRRQYDCVILDCPAALMSVDTRVIVGGVEAVLLVVRHGQTSTAAIRSARRQLNIGGDARPVGILINKAPRSFDLKQIGYEAVAR
jgi:Mrp family chromosome partitioning ATPase